MMNLVIKNNKHYDILKYTAQIVLPALATLYFALSQVWGFGAGAEVVATVTALNTFLGVVLRISTKQYNSSDDRFAGSIDVSEDEGSKRFSLNLDSDPYDLENESEVLFKINTPTDDL